MMLQIGKKYEQIALQYLKKQGLKPITQNYHCRLGEIDLVMEDNATLVFVEVRFRRNPNYGNGIESITHSKIQRIIKTAEYYLMRYQEKNRCVRFDAIGIDANQTIQWIKNAFTAES